MDWIKTFVECLAQFEGGAGITNFYAYDRAANRIRRQNLALYLAQMVKLQTQRPLQMLIGEAPGYRGCLLTGVPFTSGTIIQTGIPRWDLFGAQNGYQISGLTPKREATATMMWEVLGNGRTLPLLWNAFPFHPHKPGIQNSNRTPTQREIKSGESFACELIDRFMPQQVVAVGKSAHKALTNWSIPHVLVRHPSHGGKKAFAIGVRQLEDSHYGMVSKTI